jgi:hypothetical protein
MNKLSEKGNKGKGVRSFPTLNNGMETMCARLLLPTSEFLAVVLTWSFVFFFFFILSSSKLFFKGGRRNLEGTGRERRGSK